MSYTVLIVEDDLRLRASFAHAIRDAVDLQLVGEADDLPEGMRLLDALQPKVFWPRNVELDSSRGQCDRR
jgi:response regulator of citrate/malate metabolism